ncbi:MAG: YciI family protein [Rhodospirillales bacterium]|nr:YciI family protein [Rhodospirillales bacterium]
MLFVVLTTDKPNSAGIRAGNRPAHLAYLEGFGTQIVAGGATLSDNGEAMTGSFLLVDMADRAAVEAFAAGDPFAKAGLFEKTEIRRWRKVIFNPPKD